MKSILREKFSPTDTENDGQLYFEIVSAIIYIPFVAAHFEFPNMRQRQEKVIFLEPMCVT